MPDPLSTAQSHLHAADLPAAAATLRAAAADPSATADLKRRAGHLIVTEQIYEAFDLAERCLTDYLATPDADPAYHALLAHALWVNGRSSQSIDAYRAALTARPDDPNLLASLGMVLLSAGRHLDAYLAYTAALGLRPDHPTARLGRAAAHRLLTNNRQVEVPFAGETLRFALTGKAVEVDFAHLQGTLTEATELSHLAQLAGQLDTIVDVGGNVGNHACFFAKVLKPRRLIVFEANPRCLDPLKTNLALNTPPGTTVDVRCTAVGREPGTLVLPLHDDLNTGLVKESQTPSQTVPVQPLDAEIDHLQFLKIDVEGMELDVLTGAEKLIARCRPILFVEVHRQNRQAFDALLERWNYVPVSTYPYPAHTNVIATAREHHVT